MFRHVGQTYYSLSEFLITLGLTIIALVLDYLFFTKGIEKLEDFFNK